MKYFKKIIGEKIYLSPMSTEDIETYARWLNNSDVTDGLGTGESVVSLSQEKEYIENSQKNNEHLYGIVLNETDTLIGNIGIEDIDQISRSATVGLFIGDEENRGKGYGTEALRIACRYAFDKLNIHSIHLWVFDFNERAINAYKKVGFKESGRLREAYFLDGKYHDHILMDMLRDELNELF